LEIQKVYCIFAEICANNYSLEVKNEIFM